MSPVVRTILPWLPWLLALASCSTPPKPPTVDESRRRPVNTAIAVELQTCRNDLDNTRIVATEHQRRADAGSVALAQMVQQQIAQQEAVERMLAQQQDLAQKVATASSVPTRNLLVPVHFAFGSTQISIAEREASRVVAEARAAPLVLLRGRTDGAIETPAESHIARRRAAAVEDYLVQAGVGRERIRTTWQPVGDHAADNTTAGGRALNRRVEIEVYRAAPITPASSAFAAVREPDTTSP